MNTKVTENYAKIKPTLLLIPIGILVGMAVLLFSKGNLSTLGYVKFQQELFFALNSKLSQFPVLEYNITQLGDAFIALSLLSIFISYAPKIWEALLMSSLLSLLFSKGLKEFFDVPRPVTIFGEEQVHIIGETLVGYSSLPSGHSITIFTTLTVLMYAFVGSLHKSPMVRSLAVLGLVAVGFFVALSRVGVGAHHPLDVLMGSCLGYSSAVLGIWITNRYPIFKWVKHKNMRPFFALLFIGSFVFLGKKIAKENLMIYYFPLVSLLASLYLIIKSYVKKVH